MNSRTTKRFRQMLAKLPGNIRQQAKGAYKLFTENPHHPSLQFKKIHNTELIYSVAGFAVQAIYRFGYDVLFNKVLEALKKQGKTEEDILEEIESYPIPEWLKLRVRGYIENMDFEETIASVDLSNRQW